MSPPVLAHPVDLTDDLSRPVLAAEVRTKGSAADTEVGVYRAGRTALMADERARFHSVHVHVCMCVNVYVWRTHDEGDSQHSDIHQAC